MNTLLGILPFLVVGCHFIDKWFLSQAKLYPVYVLTILGSLATALFNVLLYLDQNCTKSILIFILTSAWSIAMACKGLHRLVKAKHKLRPYLWE